MRGDLRNGLTFIANSCAAFLLCAVAPAAAGEDDRVARLIASYNQSGLDLYRRLGETPGNVVISPYGIGVAMAMALAGARGETETEMARVLRHVMPRAGIDDANTRLRDRLAKRLGEIGAQVSTANALHLTKSGAAVAPSYRQLLAGAYGAELFEGSDLAAINGWARQRTDGRIKQILRRLDPASVCVLLSAIHFKGAWAAQFDEARTRPGDFHVSKAETVQVPVMTRKAAFRVVRGDDFDVVALPYAGESLAMLILLPPREGGLGDLETRLDVEAVKSVTAALERAPPQKIVLSLPRFTVAFATDLSRHFKALGMKLAFDPDRADFGGIVRLTKERDRLHISQIANRTIIEVNEQGTEAAGAAAVEFSQRSMQPPSETFLVDRPFLYLVTDQATGMILFMGRVVDPRSKGP